MAGASVESRIKRNPFLLGLQVVTSASLCSCFFGDPVHKTKPVATPKATISIEVPGDFSTNTLRLVAVNTSDPSQFQIDPATGVPFGSYVIQTMKAQQADVGANVIIGSKKSMTLGPALLDASTTMFAYIDLNGNGLLDQNEPFGTDPNNPVSYATAYDGKISVNRVYPSTNLMR